MLQLDADGICGQEVVNTTVRSRIRRYIVFVPNVFEEKPQQCLEKLLIVPFVVKLDGCFASRVFP